MGGGQSPAPMDGASDVPTDPMGGPGDPGAPVDDMGMAPNDGQNIGTGPGMEDPSMGGEPPMDGMGGTDGQLNPDMGGDAPMDDEPPMDGEMGGEEGDDSTISIINQLSPEDREAVRSYAESMLSRDESNGEGMEEEPPMGGDEPVPGPDGQGNEPPMMESVIFTKKQLKKINENMMTMKTDDEKGPKKMSKKGNSLGKKSPFNSPKFK